jgi:surfeit locus 1 family protein
MRPHFHPLPALTIACAVLFASLVSLGVWQLDRLQWKLGLIAEVNRNLGAAPVSLDAALGMGAGAQYRRVALDGRFENAKEAYVFTTGPDGAPVYHVLTPFVADDGRVLIVDRGAVPIDHLDPKTRTAGLVQGERHVVGVWRVPDAPGAFTPAPDLTHRIWYSRDIAGIAKADGLVFAAPVVVEADATPNPGGLPVGGQTRVEFRNEHLQYAITWFGLAAALLLIYFVYHRSRGRLGFRRSGDHPES